MVFRDLSNLGDPGAARKAFLDYGRFYFTEHGGLTGREASRLRAGGRDSSPWRLPAREPAARGGRALAGARSGGPPLRRPRARSFRDARDRTTGGLLASTRAAGTRSRPRPKSPSGYRRACCYALRFHRTASPSSPASLR